MRKLRITENNSNETQIAPEPVDLTGDRKLRVANSDMLKKADRLLELKSLLAQRESENKALKEEIGLLQGELMDYGRENHLENLMSENALVQFQSRVSRSIDPRGFLNFLHEHGRAKDFYNFCDIPITAAMKNFGEAVLTSAGVLTSICNDYASVKVSARK